MATNCTNFTRIKFDKIGGIRGNQHIGNMSGTGSAVLGSRNSVMFDKPATTADVIDPTTLAYAPRQVDIDNYHSYSLLV